MENKRILLLLLLLIFGIILGFRQKIMHRNNNIIRISTCKVGMIFRLGQKLNLGHNTALSKSLQMFFLN